MKKDIILAGVGGQGILSIAAIIGTAAIESDLYLKPTKSAKRDLKNEWYCRNI